MIHPDDVEIFKSVVVEGYSFTNDSGRTIKVTFKNGKSLRPVLVQPGETVQSTK